MRIGIYIPITNSKIGGGNRYQKETLRALNEYYDDTDHKFTLIGLEPVHHMDYVDDAFDYYHLHRSVYEKIIDKLNKLLHYTVCFVKCRKQKYNYSWIDFKLRNIGINALLYLSPWHFLTLDIPYITVVWDLEHRRQPYFPEVSNNGEWTRREELFQTRLRRASFVITGTEVGKHEINSYYQVAMERIIVIPFAIPGYIPIAYENVIENKQVLEKYNITSGYLFYPAVFWSHKNHITIVLATKILKEKHNVSLNVVFVGNDKGNKRYIESEVQRFGLMKQFSFLGHVSDNDLTALYINALALIYVSQFGPDNLPPLEALALGCPVVATRSQGSLEQLGQSAILINTMDPDELASAVIRIKNDEAICNVLVENGLKLTKNRHYSNYILSLFKVIDELALFVRCWESCSSKLKS